MALLPTKIGWIQHIYKIKPIYVNRTYKALYDLASLVAPLFLSPPSHALYTPATHNLTLITDSEKKRLCFLRFNHFRKFFQSQMVSLPQIADQHK